VTSWTITVENKEGEDVEEGDVEWFIPGFGVDEEYLMWERIYIRARDQGRMPYAGGWLDGLHQHNELIDFFTHLDCAIQEQDNGNG
jgi:hypothetical protein